MFDLFFDKYVNRFLNFLIKVFPFMMFTSKKEVFKFEITKYKFQNKFLGEFLSFFKLGKYLKGI